MYPPSLGSSDGSSQHSSICSCGRSFDSGSLYRAPTNVSSFGAQSTSDPPQKIRYGGRGGAGSRARSMTLKSPIVAGSTVSLVRVAESQAANFKAKWLKRSAAEPSDPSNSSDDIPPVPAMPSNLSSLAGRRGAINVPSPLILRDPPSRPVPGIKTPSTAASTASNSTGTESDVPCTPRSPYFYFDEPLESPSVRAESPLPSPSATSSISRSLRRFASRTLLKDLFVKAPPRPATPTSPTWTPAEKIASPRAPPPTPGSPMFRTTSPTWDAVEHIANPLPTTPTSPSFRAPMSPRTSASLTSPSQTSVVISEWFDPPETLHQVAETAVHLPTVVEPVVDPPVVALELPTSGGRTRSASEVTVKPQRRQKGERKQREPRSHGKWNRSDMGEVIVGLRMLK
ncbi:hypothetical protein C8R43DRAFT_18246 [Mycena crocata]|nr:hypothetical protein C8R43DRAFT_18246 [Mycena crocata]